MKQWQFQNDPSLLSFHTSVRSCSQLSEGVYGVILEDTIFSPEGDRGVLQGQVVSQVQWSGEDIMHYVDHYIAPGSMVLLEVDGEQREAIRAHTTARMLLGHLVSDLLKSYISSSEMTHDGGFIDMKREFLNPSEVKKLIHGVHDFIAEGRTLKMFTVPYSQAADIYKKHRVYLEETRDQVPLVEIQGLGVFPYLGMIFENAGDLGCIAMLGTSKQEGKIRLYVAAGQKARRRVVEQAITLDKVRRHLGVHETQIMDTLKRKQQEFSVIASEYNKSFQEFLRQELQKIDEQAPVVVNFYKEISQENLKIFAEKAIELFPSKIFVFFSQEGASTHYICRGPQNSRYDMQQLSQFIARCINGRGEGTANVAEGVGAGQFPEDELVHMCATFLQNYRLNRPRSLSRKPHDVHVLPEAQV